MSKLHDLQRQFSAAMRAESEGVTAYIDAGALGAAAQLGIYRNAIASTRLRTLSESYPTVRALVGSEFFEQLAQRYAALHPSHSGNLCDYGGHFAAFIEQSPEAIEPVPYLADVARLEWLRQEAALAADVPVTAQPQHLSNAGGDRHRLRATFHPSMRSLRSAFPVFALLRWCESPTDAAPRLEDEPECGLIWREDGEVALSAIHPASYAFAHALLQGDSLEAALAAGRSHDADFDADECLRSLVDRGLIVGFTPAARSS